MVCRLFIDEVGNGDLKGAAHDDNARFLSLTGILTKQDIHDQSFQPAVLDFKKELLGSDAIILHRREIMRREGAFTVLRDDKLRALFDTRLLLLIRELPYIVSTVTIDKREHLNTYKVWQFQPYHYCLRCLIERYVLWLARHGTSGDVAIEPRTPKADEQVKNSFELIYKHGTQHVAGTTIQKHLTSREIKFFSKARNIAAMQLCDLVAHPSYRYAKLKKFNQSVPKDFGSAVVSILLERKYARHPKSKKIEGWGLKWLPK